MAHLLNQIEDDALFQSAEDAVRFALSRSGRAQRPAMSRMIDARSGRKAFSDLDAAAQAGMIMNVIEGAGRLAVSVMTASAAPRSLPCSCRRPCCSGNAINLEWHRALHFIAESAYTDGPCKLRYTLRVACVFKAFSAGEQSFKKIADDVQMDAETVSKHYKGIIRWLRGAKASKHGEPVEGIESIAWREAEESLRAAGIVG